MNCLIKALYKVLTSFDYLELVINVTAKKCLLSLKRSIGWNFTEIVILALWSYHYGNLGLVTHYSVIVKLPSSKDRQK